MNTTSSMHFTAPRRALAQIAALLCVILVLLILYGIDCCVRCNRVTVRNSSGHAVTDIVLELRSLDGRWKLTKRVPSLPPGRLVVFRHSQNDTRARLCFRIDGVEREYEEAKRFLNTLKPPWTMGFYPQVEFLRLSLHKSLTSRAKERRGEQLKCWENHVNLAKERRKFVDEYKALLATRRRLMGK